MCLYSEESAMEKTDMEKLINSNLNVDKKQLEKNIKLLDELDSIGVGYHKYSLATPFSSQPKKGENKARDPRAVYIKP